MMRNKKKFVTPYFQIHTWVYLISYHKSVKKSKLTNALACVLHVCMKYTC